MSIDRRRVHSGYVPLRVAMDRLFEGSFIGPQSMYGEGAFPPADMHMTDDDVIICLSVAGARPDDINIAAAGNTVSISGQVRHSHRSPEPSEGSTQGRRQTFLEEVWQGAFQRTFTLPTQVDAGKATADYEDGILTLTLPKAEANKPRTIQVQGRGKALDGEKVNGKKSSDAKETVPVQGGSK